MTENEIGTLIVKTAIQVHRGLGPGLLESVYEVVLTAELNKCGLSAQRQVAVPISYNGHHFVEGFRADIIVNNKVIIELKSVKEISPAHKKQIQTYLRLSDMKLGFLLNYGSALMKDGIVRAVNNLDE